MGVRYTKVNKRFRKLKKFRKVILILGILFIIVIGAFLFKEYSASNLYLIEYEEETYQRSLYKGDLYAQNLCVTNTDVPLNGFDKDETLHAAGLFDIKHEKVLYADRLFERIYPASTTKVMTAYVAIKYGNLDDIVTVSERATNFAWDEQVCGLQAGEQISLRDLLGGLLLYSGNDTAIAIAEHISGSVEAFVDVMNEEARLLGATGSHFVNPHGLHDLEHYMTAYDLYLIFNAALREQSFVDILSMPSYTATLISSTGVTYTTTWYPTNYYATGNAQAPEGVRVIGGKTGTTDEAGSCLILYNQDLENNPYISVVMGGSTKGVLYENMTRLLGMGIS
ncbi:MAG: D-alanyl-D-alanine carboxypeptidase [Candidatus Ruminococcus intestinipullorum]|nr:D-alanyl-D-alanine carboxypeptidase [Candidatus Ruminococcus intestinipullorum]